MIEIWLVDNNGVLPLILLIKRKPRPPRRRMVYENTRGERHGCRRHCPGHRPPHH